jgi:hypothetical protein
VLPPPARFRRSRPRAREQVFGDAAGVLWCAALVRSDREWAVVFTCITDARHPVRAVAIAAEPRIEELTESTLRHWLEQAPRIGPLT